MGRTHRLDPARWSWQVGRSLAGYLRGLPTSGPEARIALAIHRQAVLTNHRSVFSPEPGGHHGVGADLYARFTAPMREVVGVFVHKEAWERLSGQAGAQRTDEELRARVVDSANRARSLQRELDREANRMVLDQMLGQDLREDPPPVRTGTVMGLTRSKVHVKLDDPALDVKVYVRHLEGRAGRLDLGPGEVSLVRGRQVVCRVGDPVGVRVVSHDDRRNRWRFELVG